MKSTDCPPLVGFFRQEVSADATPLPKQRPLETVAEYSRRLQQAVKSKLQAPGLPLSTQRNGGKWCFFHVFSYQNAGFIIGFMGESTTVHEF